MHVDKEVFEVGIRDSAGFEANKFNITRTLQITNEWQKFTISLDELRQGTHQQRGPGMVDLMALENINIGFNRALTNMQTGETGPARGTIYIDDLAFER